MDLIKIIWVREKPDDDKNVRMVIYWIGKRE
jgi:hypothetical protein